MTDVIYIARRKSWAQAGFEGAAYDILINPYHDLTSFEGCVTLLGLLVQLLGVVIGLTCPCRSHSLLCLSFWSEASRWRNGGLRTTMFIVRCGLSIRALP